MISSCLMCACSCCSSDLQPEELLLPLGLMGIDLKAPPAVVENSNNKNKRKENTMSNCCKVKHMDLVLARLWVGMVLHRLDSWD